MFKLQSIPKVLYEKIYRFKQKKKLNENIEQNIKIKLREIIKIINLVNLEFYLVQKKTKSKEGCAKCNTKDKRKGKITKYFANKVGN